MDKNILWSKTFWVGVITALVPLFPVIDQVVKAYPQAVLSAVGIIFIILRKVTAKPVTVLPK